MGRLLCTKHRVVGRAGHTDEEYPSHLLSKSSRCGGTEGRGSGGIIENTCNKGCKTSINGRQRQKPRVGVVQNNWPHSFKNSTESNGRLDSKTSTVKKKKRWGGTIGISVWVRYWMIARNWR